MICVAEQSEVPLENAASDRALYEILKNYIGHTVMIRRQVIERMGVLQRLSYRREGVGPQERIVFDLGDGEAKAVNPLHRVEVRIDGVWKVLNPGSPTNREL